MLSSKLAKNSGNSSSNHNLRTERGVATIVSQSLLNVVFLTCPFWEALKIGTASIHTLQHHELTCY